MLPEIFKTRDHPTSLAQVDEANLIHQAQSGNKDATWDLVTQYAGLLQTTAYSVRSRLPNMTIDQQEDLESALVLATLEAIQAFDMHVFMRLSQVLPGKLRDVAFETTTALAVPRGTLNLWFKIWRAAEGNTDVAVDLAPSRGMSTDTFRAIAHSLEYTDSAWATLPYDAGKPTADAETHRLAHLALAALMPAEREVVEYFYGFRGDVKTDQEVANLRGTTKTSAVQTRQRALTRMRETLNTSALDSLTHAGVVA